MNRLHPEKPDQRGVTLIELLVTMGLMSIFLVVVTTIFTASFDVQAQSSNYAAVTADGRFVLMRLAYDIRRASAVTAPSLGASDGSLGLTIDGKNYVYDSDSGRLRLTVDGNSDYLTSRQSQLSGLNFEALGVSGGPAAVRYSFTLTGTGGTQADSQAYLSTTELRP
ncbi:MAG TPA: prepilin-type N-terminal cleavage/methylation domain-containing protein [Candidatus Saccharimonadales bacterium]|nr:prepilin-type N-terminal cleavage/methylation domain-containing protein [Candidatus Saccharimonadales bacterium]